MFGWKKKLKQAYERTIRCSFCNKSQHDVAKMIAGPNVQICDECVEICVDVLAHDKPAGKRRTPASEQPDYDRWCSICRLQVPLASSIAVAERGYLCRECAAAVAAAFSSLPPN